ncbi:MAG: T9SS C-terminal target domain-containing protein [Calditrichaeota bacterium]|nr:MAG: T9SS C-terminal target domain-containing protein [Calditrichota bacterium]
MYRYNSEKMFVSTDEGLYYTENGGREWSQIKTIDWDTIIHSYYEIKPGELLLATSKGICISRYHVHDFYPPKFELYALEGHNVISVCIDNQDNIWAGTDTGIFKSNNGEFDWQLMNLPEDWYTKILCDSGNVIYVLSNHSVWKTDDSGATWWFLDGIWLGDILLDQEQNLIITNTYQLLGANNQGIQWVSRISRKSLLTSFPMNNSELLVGTLGTGLFKYDISNDQFSDFENKGLDAACILSILSLANGDLLTCTAAESLYLSTDDGLTWESTCHCWSLCMESSDNGSVYVAAHGGIIRSDDFGRTWEKLNIDVSPYYVNAIDTRDVDRVICAGTSQGEVYVSGDLGRTFELKRNSDDNFVNHIQIVDRYSFFVVLSNGHITYTDDSGHTFIDLPNVPDNTNDIAFDNLQYIYLAGDNGVFKSMDGKNWHAVLKDVPRIQHLRVDEHDNIYAATHWGKVYFSNDHGKNWNLISEDCPNSFFISFDKSSRGYIFNGSQDKGLFRNKFEITQRMISDISVSPNFPNPFHSETRIEYRLSEPGFVNVKVYNILGKELATLVSQYKNSGEYFAVWQPGHLASGTYLAKVLIGRETHIIKMLLLK